MLSIALVYSLKEEEICFAQEVCVRMYLPPLMTVLVDVGHFLSSGTCLCVITLIIHDVTFGFIMSAKMYASQWCEHGI